MSPINRTKEFQATVESIIHKKDILEQQRLLQLQQQQSNLSSSSNSATTNDFTHTASAIAKNINQTVARLQRLTVLAKRRTPFDDGAMELNDLIGLVKQDIGRINRSIDGLQQLAIANKNKAKNKGSGNNNDSTLGSQAKEHNHNVIVSLQSKLAATSNEFKNVLEVRTQNMREQKNRMEQYGTTTNPILLNNNNNSSSSIMNNNNNMNDNVLPLYQKIPSPVSNSSDGLGISSVMSNTNNDLLMGSSNSPYPGYHPLGGALGKNKEANNLAPNGLSSNSSSFVSINMFDQHDTTTDRDPLLPKPSSSSSLPPPPENASLGLGSIIGGQQELLLANPVHTDYLDSRSQAIDSIESTIAELGQIYQHFAQVLAGQRENVQRIDDNIADVEANVMGAQNQLMKYYNSISSNRWLMIKVLGILLIFFLIFVMFL